MTVSAQTPYNTPVGNGVTTVFPYQFKILAAADLQVYVSGVLKTLNVDYSVSGVGVDVGGSVTFLLGAPASLAPVSIIRAMTAKRATDYQQLGDFQTTVVNPDFDNAILLIQDSQTQLGRSIRTPADEVSTLPTLPSIANRASKFIAFDASGLPIASAGTGGGDSALRTDLANSSAGSEGVALVGFRASGVGAAARTLRTKLRDVVDVRDFGSAGDGVTDDTTAFQNLAASGATHLTVGPGTYKVTASIVIQANQHWFLNGANFVITGNTQVFTATTVNDWTMRGSWSVTGDNGAAGATAGTGAALKIVDCMRFIVDGPIAKNIKGWGILIQPGASVSSRAEHGQIVAPHAYACYRGIEVQAGTGAEYVTISDVNVSRCNVGLKLAAGNVNLNGGTSTDNTDNLEIGPGSNHAHGIICGVNLNHATQYNVHCDNVVNGQTFIGCHIYGLDAIGAGAIFLDQCKGVQFIGGHMDCWIYNYKGASSGINRIRGMYSPGAYGLKRAAGTNNGHDQLLIEDCYGPGSLAVAGDAIDAAGVSMNDVSSCHAQYTRAPAATQALTSGVAADLLFPTKVFDRRAVVNAGTGVFTVPTGNVAQAGMYRIRANMLFTGTAMSTTASFVELKVNGTSKRLALPEIFSTTTLRIALEEEIYLNAADVVKLTGTITGTTPVFGNGTWESWLSVERIA